MAKITTLQQDHFDRITAIANKHKVYLDTSATGVGKTYIACEYARVNNLDLMIVCPKIVMSKWDEVASNFGVYAETYTYEKIRGNGNPKHPYLTKDIETKEYAVTKDYEEKVNKGILLVLDEVQKAKNASAQRDACISLSSYIFTSKGNSKLALLSASPFDKYEHALSFARIMGITNKDKLYDYTMTGFGIGIYTPVGLKDIQNWCNKIDPQKGVPIFRTRLSNKTADKICYDALHQIVKPALTSSAPMPNLGIQRDAKNGFFIVDDKDKERLSAAINRLENMVRAENENGKLKPNYGDITAALIPVEKAKLNLFMRLVTETLEKYKCKVVLYLHYLDHIAYVNKMLEKYNPLVLVGSGPLCVDDRDKVINAFQENNGKYRLLISNPRVGSVGIDLDDKIGDYPRYMFISPDYRFIDLYQATGRIYRMSTRSDVTIRFVYGKGKGEHEVKILDTLAKKTAVVKSMLHNQNVPTFPGEMPYLYE